MQVIHTDMCVPHKIAGITMGSDLWTHSGLLLLIGFCLYLSPPMILPVLA